MLPLIALVVATSTASPPPGPKVSRPNASQSYDEDAEVNDTDPEPEEEEQYYEYDPRDPRYLPYDEDIPPGYVPGSRIRVGWLIAGAAVFVGLYAYTSFLFAITEENDEVVFIPGIGPIIFAAKGGSGETAGDTVLVIDGLLQMTAVAVAIWAVTDPRKLLIREDLAVTPFFLDEGGGVGVTGRF